MKTKLFFTLLFAGTILFANAQNKAIANAKPATSLTRMDATRTATSKVNLSNIKPVTLNVQKIKTKTSAHTKELQQRQKVLMPKQRIRKDTVLVKKEDTEPLLGCCCLIKDEIERVNKYIWCSHGAGECIASGGTVVDKYICEQQH